MPRTHRCSPRAWTKARTQCSKRFGGLPKSLALANAESCGGAGWEGGGCGCGVGAAVAARPAHRPLPRRPPHPAPTSDPTPATPPLPPRPQPLLHCALARTQRVPRQVGTPRNHIRRPSNLRRQTDKKRVRYQFLSVSVVTRGATLLEDTGRTEQRHAPALGHRTTLTPSAKEDSTRRRSLRRRCWDLWYRRACGVEERHTSTPLPGRARRRRVGAGTREGWVGGRSYSRRNLIMNEREHGVEPRMTALQ